ncbi:MAG: RHS repeat-associated core domain-containing protein [Candidatus Obscuribacterales bacterium]
MKENRTPLPAAYAGIRPIAEYDGSDTFVRHYVHGPALDEVLLAIDSINDVTYLRHDRLGSIIATTDDTGAVIDTYAHSRQGVSGSLSATWGGGTWQRYDAETGLYFYKKRHYLPVMGRFLQPDPIVYGDGLNMY